jgi:hypothetical protein
VGRDGSAVSRTEVVVDVFLAWCNELAGYTQRSEPVSSRNCCALNLSVMKRRPVVADICRR